MFQQFVDVVKERVRVFQFLDVLFGKAGKD